MPMHVHALVLLRRRFVHHDVTRWIRDPPRRPVSDSKAGRRFLHQNLLLTPRPKRPIVLVTAASHFPVRWPKLEPNRRSSPEPFSDPLVSRTVKDFGPVQIRKQRANGRAGKLPVC